MAKRNMFKTASLAKNHIDNRYCIDNAELTELRTMLQSGSQEEIFTALITAFEYGYVLGGRAVANGAKPL